MNWIAFQDYLEEELPGNPTINDKAIDKCTEELISTIHEALAVSAPEHQPRGDPLLIYPLELE